MMDINITEITEIETFTNALRVSNSLTNGAFVGFMLVSLMFVIFFITKVQLETEKALLVTFWLGFIISILLSATGLLSVYFVLFFGVVAALGTFYVWMSQR